jgi:hypothetical protein
VRWEGHVAHMAEIRNLYKFLVGRPERGRRLRGRKHRWEDNIKTDLIEM